MEYHLVSKAESYLEDYKLKELLDKQTVSEYLRSLNESDELVSETSTRIEKYFSSKHKYLVRDVLGRLPQVELSILSLYFWNEMTFYEIANKTSLSPQNVIKIYQTAINRFKKMFLQYFHQYNKSYFDGFLKLSA
ncbi:MAG: sigma-70 family RNA polymerase sigma factor [Oligoflexia bacterium]|nr:sigma-70 family RNA polymerase sigma factor [Oligoflexia bacterium]